MTHKLFSAANDWQTNHKM